MPSPIHHKKLLPNPAAAVGSVLNIHPRFMRSVHLERDIKDPASSRGYILTPPAQQALQRITTTFRYGSTQRAWRITGDYGSGKTDFALALARVAAKRISELPTELHPFVTEKSLMPLLATGDREPLAHTVMRALGRPIHPKTAISGRRLPGDDVLAALRQTVDKARRRGHGGVLIVLDELGKNLEYAARHPDLDDIFLLQRLADEAAGSGSRPVAIVAILHQAVTAYSSGLESAGKKEWAKISGRFEEIVYAHHLDQVATLVAATLSVDAARVPENLRRQAVSAMRTAVGLGLYGASAATSLIELAPHLFPLHPTVIPALVRTMRIFGQNERSLFSFLSSAEPFGLQEHALKTLEMGGFFRLHNLFDYLRSNSMPGIQNGSAATNWGVIESILSATRVSSPEEGAVLKTVALLALLDSPDLPASEEMILLSVNGTPGLKEEALVASIDDLRGRGVLYERGSIKGLCLWPHTSVNLDEVFAKAMDATQQESSDFAQLCSNTRLEPIVPRGYYVRTGTLRYAHASLVPASDLDKLLLNQPTLRARGPDLLIRIILPRDKAQQNIALEKMRTAHGSLSKGLFLAVAAPPGDALPALADVLAWRWVRDHTTELSGDRYAREEVTRQVERAERKLQDRLSYVTSLSATSVVTMPWFSNQGIRELHSGKGLLSFLDQECVRIYNNAPRVRNELINRDSPSSAAVAARTKLVEAMASFPLSPYLGMDKTKRPAEMALYLSVLKAGNIHVNEPTGCLFQIPRSKKDKCNLVPSFNQITKTLREAGVDSLVPLPQIFEVLALPPYGIRHGLIPFIAAIYLATHHQRVALYEDGTYCHHAGGDEFLRLMKEPQFFHLQYCALEGIRSQVFARLLQLLEIPPRDAKQSDLIDLVRPLVVFISQEVPDYARRTNTLSATTIATRSALLEAREPVRLVFTSLPEACGLQPFSEETNTDPKEFAGRLATAMHELRTAYPKLIDRLGSAICAAFDLSNGLTADRPIISKRAADVSSAITEPTLRAFALRIADPKLESRPWIESVANFLAKKSPERWVDADEAEFCHQLELSAGRFRRVEALYSLGAKRQLNGHACRIALTKADGTEVDDLINWDGLKEDEVTNQISKIITHHGRRGIAAAVRALWTELNSTTNHEPIPVCQPPTKPALPK